MSIQCICQVNKTLLVLGCGWAAATAVFRILTRNAYFNDNNKNNNNAHLGTHYTGSAATRKYTPSVEYLYYTNVRAVIFFPGYAHYNKTAADYAVYDLQVSVIVFYWRRTRPLNVVGIVVIERTLWKRLEYNNIVPKSTY